MRRRKNHLLRPFLIALGLMALLLVLGTYLSRLLAPSSAAPEPVTIPDQEERQATNPWGWVSQAAAQNEYDENGFLSVGGVVDYHAGGKWALQGLDLSAHNGEIDWAQVKNAGIDFVILQLGYRGYTAGTLSVDEAFFRNLDGATEQGIAVGAYFFSQALSEEEAREEADFVVKTLSGCKLDLPIYFDWETVSGGGRSDQMDTARLTDCALAFCRRIEDAGFQAGIYFNQEHGYFAYNLDLLGDYSFWLAEYASVPSFYFHFDLWQYTPSGSVPGIEGSVDRNLLFPEP